MVLAFAIAREDRFRAVTHNKGILNGMDAVIMATGNDYRAVEAGVHAFASRNGSYGSLSRAWIDQDIFYLELDVPLALGTVGGLTSSHPLAALSLELLGHPDARELMMITAAAGLANNFSAVRALVTTGIQQGHMKMHLENMLRQLQATPREAEAVRLHFEGHTLSHAAVKAFLEQFKKGDHA